MGGEVSAPVDRPVLNVQTDEGEGYRTYRRKGTVGKELVGNFDPPCANLAELWTRTVAAHPDATALAWRAKNDDGTFGAYVTQTFAETDVGVRALGAFLTSTGELSPGQPLGLWSINRPQWDTADLAAQMYGLMSVPLYASLGPSAVEYVIGHAKLTVIVCSGKRLPSLLALQAEQKIALSLVVLMEEVPRELAEQVQRAEAEHGLRVVTWVAAIAAGAKVPREPVAPTHDSVRVVMYTSGTTGEPKGVVHTHGTLLASLAGFDQHGGLKFSTVDRCLSYLPSAHLLQMVLSMKMFESGASLWYYHGDPLKLFEDCALVHPTFFVGVPRVLNKIRSGVLSKVEGAGTVSSTAFHLAYARKLAALKAGSWTYFEGVFGRARQAIGLDQVRFIISGSAPLDAKTQEFMQVVFAPVLQGYGLSETGAALTAQPVAPFNPSGQAGKLLQCVEMRLVSIPEMDYLVSDKQPRGEIVVRGPMLFREYFLKPEVTRSVVRDGWFHTGDVGQVDVYGSLCIIDRIKNIFKLSQGEYVAIEHVENVYARDPFVAMVFGYGDSSKRYLVGVVVPDGERLKQHARDRGYPDAEDVAALCGQSAVVQDVLESLCATARAGGLRGFEVFKGLHLEPIPFSVDNNMLTPSFKLRRHQCRIHYSAVLAQLYAQAESSG